MEQIETLCVEPCERSEYIRLQRMVYVQEGVEKRWDIAKVHDSVAVLLYHRELDAFVLVRQFRPPVFLQNGDGFTFELCAGIVDKEKPLYEIAREEVLEECGYDVPGPAMRRVTSFHTASGFAGAKQTLFFAEIDESMKVHEGGGVGVEAIEVVTVGIGEAKAFALDETKVKTPGLMFAFMWYFDREECRNG